jgi:hypothetical protein
MFRGGGGGVRIDSPEELIGAILVVAILAALWYWKVAN